MLLVHAAFGRKWRGRAVREVEMEVVSEEEIPAEAFRELSPEDDVTGADVELSSAPLPAAPPDEFGAADESGPAPAAMAPAAAPSVSLREWTCEIALWRSYGKTAFYARTFREGEEVVVAESRPFQSNGGEIPEPAGAALEAHRALCDELVRAGWERLGRRHTWYSDMFRRDFSVAGLVASLNTRISFVRSSSSTS
jgi:hypothetical protein